MKDFVPEHQSSELVLQNEDRAGLPAQQIPQPMRLLELAVAQNADIDKLERLMAMQTQWEEKSAKREFLAALSSFQTECPNILKGKQGHNSNYAPLSDIVAAVRGLLYQHGLSYRFEQEHSSNSLIKVTCVVSHESGHSESNCMLANPDASGNKNAIQAIGSTVTYLMRYTFMGALGITTADVDTDGGAPVYIPQVPPIDRRQIIEKIKAILEQQKKTEAGFFQWFTKGVQRPTPLNSFEEMRDDELGFALNKQEARK